MQFSGYETLTLKADDLNISEMSDGASANDSKEIIFNDINIPSCSVDISATGFEGYKKIIISFTVDNFAYSFKEAGKYRFYFAGKTSTNTFKINPAGNLRKLKIELDKDCQNFTIESVTLNKRPSLTFNFFRF